MNSAFEIIRQTLREIPGFLEGLDKRAQADRWAAYHSSAQPAARPAQPASGGPSLVHPLSPEPMAQPPSPAMGPTSAQASFNGSTASFVPYPAQQGPAPASPAPFQNAGGFPPVQPPFTAPAQPVPSASAPAGFVRPLSPEPLPMDAMPRTVETPPPPRSGSIYRELMQKHDRMSPRHLS